MQARDSLQIYREGQAEGPLKKAMELSSVQVKSWTSAAAATHTYNPDITGQMATGHGQTESRPSMTGMKKSSLMTCMQLTT